MGRAGKKRSRQDGKGGPRENVWKYDTMGTEDMKCEALDAYYKLQEGIIEEGEWEKILEVFRKPLPITFRVNQSNDEDAQRTIAAIRKIQEGMREAGVPEDKMLKEVEWFPGEGMCWEAKMTKKELSRDIPGARPLHEFLLMQTERGKVSRQEVVSMIPPLFLDVQPDHLVLDSCAAPGSKTAQIMESLARHKGEISGCVIANDMDAKRCEVLVRQTQRLRELYPNLIVTNHNASLFPNPVVPSPPHEGETKPRLKKIQFDRILNDVVCSGDGTFRKSLDLWGRWNPGMGISTHKAQCNILLKSMDLLKEGGRLVYSTCSLNPIEDEAVLNHCLKTCPHEFELVDCSKMLPELKRSPGVNKWKMTSKDGKHVWEKFSEIPAEDAKKYHYTESMFPSDDVEKYNLHHSMRFKPHLHDTGGFFIAVLQKTKEGNNVNREPKPADDGKSWEEMVAAGDIKGKALECSLLKMTPEEEEGIMKDLNVNDKFPRGQLFCRRTGDKVRRAFFFAPLAKSILEGSNLRTTKDGWPRLKLVAGGLRVAERYRAEGFRATQEATPLLSTYSNPGVTAEADRDVFAGLLSSSSHPWTHTLPKDHPLLTSLQPEGTCIITLKEDPPQTNPRLIIAAAVKKSANHLHLWADSSEVDKLRVAIGLPIPEKPKKEAKKQDDDAEDKEDKDEDDDAKRQKTE